MVDNHPEPATAELPHTLEPDDRTPAGLDIDQALATLDAEVTDGQGETVAELLVELWSSIPLHIDKGVLRLLHQRQVALAASRPTSLPMARTFRRSAAVLRDLDHLPLAVVHGRHELAVHRRRDDNPDATASALLDLSRTYRAQGRLHKVINCADEILETYGRHHDAASFKRTLAYLGSLMIEVKRPDAAIKYLTRVVTTHRSPLTHLLITECQALLSRACHLSGDQPTADRHLNRALATALRLGGTATHHVRQLAGGTRRLTLRTP